jgi:hypothetical protein
VKEVPNYEQFIAMLKAKGTPYKLFDLSYCCYIEITELGRFHFAYRFNVGGKWAGGWTVGDSPEIRKRYIHILHTGSLS